MIQLIVVTGGLLVLISYFYQPLFWIGPSLLFLAVLVFIFAVSGLAQKWFYVIIGMILFGVIFLL
ncbi:hypothetical protein [Jeotgalibacillus soli]|uniref:Uncharacterized protein n=1 Tax=Jeotgalibacillus soli TaxID=889306 RepID=A0A0C2W055_9BACL|nr:hypothetical protein [Jeotgalibacillus soli]KIL49553.1 hypothetical protein KP78_10210 [Jeotgalibacillus soli]